MSVDVEGFAESMAQSVRVDPAPASPGANDTEIEHNISVALELFARHNCRATFFSLGRIGRTAPRLVRMTADAGHEIGCHSYEHLRITG